MTTPDLEEIEGEEALNWVRAHNATCLGALQSDSRYESFYQEALAIAEAQDKIPFGNFRRLGDQEYVMNFWRDARHVRGVVRRAKLEEYRAAAPRWEIVLDVDALAEAEGRNWVYHGAPAYLPPEDRRCLVALSDGGKDASELREFDPVAKSFVEGGFHLPESKGGALWLDADSLLVWRDCGEGGLTRSGYPRSARLLRRGQSLDQAEPIFEASEEDVLVGASALRDPDGRLRAVLFTRQIDFHQGETWRWLPGEKPQKLELPLKSSVVAFVQGRLVVTTEEDWTAPSGQSFEAGDVFSWDLDAWTADPKLPATLILHPGPRETVEGCQSTNGALLLAIYENVRGSIYVYKPEAGGAWSRSRLNLPENVTVNFYSASDLEEKVFIAVTGYLTPSSLWLADAATGEVEQIKAEPARFDASGLKVEQFEARSADGTLVPYFLVRRKDAPSDGSTPTLLYGYGGFQVSLLPHYDSIVGKLWLERGGAYAVANTRGGGEFGPKWHQAALRGSRQRGHEDFQAVAQDLIARGITNPQRLGVMGGSQGGLFMGVLLTQRPDLINAAVIGVPLFDMLRFHKLSAGSSWIAEYGDPEIPEERAWLEAYSPYQNLRADQPYPEVFIHTSTKDDRVHPSHARRAAARLEELGYAPLFYENVDGGHGAAANLRESARLAALEYVYLARRLQDSASPCG